MIRSPEQMATEQRVGMRGGAGTVTVRHLFQSHEFQAPVRLCAVLTLPPGATIGLHQHASEDEVYLVTRGTGILEDGASAKPVKAGDAILTGRGDSHAVRNSGPSDLELLAVIVQYPPATT